MNNMFVLLDTTAPTFGEELGSISTALSSVLTRADLITVITACIGASVGFALLWFGIRKVKNAVVSGALKGKIRI